MLNLLKPITQPTGSHQGPLHGLGGVWSCPRQVPGHWGTWILGQISPQLDNLGKLPGPLWDSVSLGKSQAEGFPIFCL